MPAQPSVHGISLSLGKSVRIRLFARPSRRVAEDSFASGFDSPTAHISGLRVGWVGPSLAKKHPFTFNLYLQSIGMTMQQWEQTTNRAGGSAESGGMRQGDRRKSQAERGW
jgi:hypothetical protein